MLRRSPALMLLFLLIGSDYCRPTTPADLKMQFAESKRFISAHGRRAWAAGYADSGLEIWTEALQIATEVRPEFRREGDVTPIPGAEIISRIEVTPTSATRTYTGPDFSVDEEVEVPLEETAVLVHYTVRSLKPLQVFVRFRPSLNLMWPAALGGQEINWQESHSRYLLTDSAREFAAIITAPGATHHDEPLNSARKIPQTEGLAIELDTKRPQILFARIDPQDVDGSSQKLSAAVLQATTWRDEAQKNVDEVLSSVVSVETPDAELNRALAWAQVALDQDWICNNRLGCAYAAGFGPSRRNRRPQYAWFFAGDGMISMHAALAEGTYGRARDELRFIAKYQDAQTGMIWHELSQSAPYIPWREKYPYMFVHADVTYPYISAVADYIRATNDHAFAMEIWPSVQKAFSYGRSLIADDGLPRIPSGKLGLDEQHALSDELGLSASWVVACADYAHLAEVVEQKQVAQESKALADRARASFSARYWDEQRNAAIEGYRRNGEPMLGRGLGSLTAVNLGLFSDRQSARILDQVASWKFQSDWGTRSVAMGDPGFDPTGYGHGSVWALGTSNAAQGFWRAHRPDVAWQIWRTLIPWSALDSPGHMHEVLAGDTYHPQVESVPEQTWSSASFLITAITGLFGLQRNAETGTISLSPHLPAEWERASIRNVKLGDAVSSFTFQQSVSGISVHIEHTGATQHLAFRETLPLGARDVNGTVSGRTVRVSVEEHGEQQEAVLNLVIPAGKTELVMRWSGGIELTVPRPDPLLGNPSTAMKLNSVAIIGESLQVDIDAIPAQENTFQIRTLRTIAKVQNAQSRTTGAGIYEVTLGKDAGSEYRREQVKITFSR